MHIKTTRPCVLGKQACGAGEVVELDDERAAKVIERGAAEPASDKDIAAAKKKAGTKKKPDDDKKPNAGKTAKDDKSSE